MTFPLRYKVGLRTFSQSGEDAHGNPIETWSAPVEYPVYGWTAPKSTEPKLAGHNRVLVELELLAPKEFPVKATDKVVIDGEEFDVLGRPEDYSHGPFGYQPGMVVNLGRTDG